MVDLEVCVDTLSGAIAAQSGGAARVELCSALSEGGLTPSAGLMRAAATLDIPCFAMIRPRGGLFHFSERELDIMLGDIQAARDAGLAGVVLGVQDKTGALNLPVLTRLLDAADGLGTTLHRVVDVVPDPVEAVLQAVALGFDRVLTSGGAPFAPDGVASIARMVTAAQGQVSIMPGCGLTPDNVGTVVQATGVHEVHAACNRPVPGDPAFSDFDPPGGRFETSQAEVAAFVDALKR